MKSENAITNAAGIAFHLAQRGNVGDIYPLLDQVSEAAISLAEVEASRGFKWNHDIYTDWETACARIAERIERGYRCTYNIAVRMAVKG